MLDECEFEIETYVIRQFLWICTLYNPSVKTPLHKGIIGSVFADGGKCKTNGCHSNV